MKRPKSETIDFLTHDELKRLLSAIVSKRDKALFLIGYRHALRASEIGMLHVTDIDFKQHRITVRRLKGSHGGQHPLQPDELRLIKAYLKERDDESWRSAAHSPLLFPSNRNQPISRITLHKAMRQYGETARLPKEKRHFHVLKHSIVTHLLDAGEDISFVQWWAGHAQVQNTMIYTHITSASANRKARDVFLKLPKF